MIQIDMKMPTSCGYCPCFTVSSYIHNDGFGEKNISEGYCALLEEKFDEPRHVRSPWNDFKPDYCPLKEVPQEVRIRDDAEIYIKLDNLIIRSAVIVETETTDASD